MSFSMYFIHVFINFRDESILLTSSDDTTVRLYHTALLQHAPPLN